MTIGKELVKGLIRAVHGYSASDGELVVVRELPSGVDLSQLRNVFRLPTDDPMYECYPVDAAQAEFLQQYVGRLDLNVGIEWFLEAYEG